MYSIFHPELQRRAKAFLNLMGRYVDGFITKEELSLIQLQNLALVIEYTKAGSKFYKKKLHYVSNINEGDNLEQYIQGLPFTTKEDLKEEGCQVASQDVRQAWVYYETTGTTGPSTPCPRNEEDSIVNNTFLTLQYKEIFYKKTGSHIVGIMGPSELHSTGDTFEDVFRSLGHTVVKMWPRSPVVQFHRVLRLIQELKITALVCTPAIASEMIKYFKKNNINARELGVEIILVLGELITPNRLGNLGNAWGAKIYNCMYASQETSILAAANKDNELKTIPLNNYYELLNPVTNENLPVSEEPVAGELVITHLYKGNKPLIRYKTGDMVRAKLSKYGSWVIEPIGRVKDIVNLNNINFYAYDIENLIFEELEYCYEYYIEIRNIDSMDMLHVYLDECEEVKSSGFTNNLEKILSKKFKVKVTIEIGNVGNLIGTGAMVSWKAARINDTRKNEDNSEKKRALEIASKSISA